MNRLHNNPSLDNLVVDVAEKKARQNNRYPYQNTSRPVSHNSGADASHDSIALILAGGRGTRLHPLTQRRSKPAVPFGGSFRIIDFTLSNCINSGIRRVGVFTQYEQQSLIKHLQEGWNFLRRESGEFIDVMPAQQRHGATWYQGTADAITQNQEFLRHHAPQNTLILAGDHIYKADYRRMIQQHVTQNADVTIACYRVPLETASQFGIVESDERSRIVGFSEKPDQAAGMKEHPHLAQASMGLYVFKTELLLQCLNKDSRNLASTHDFGADIIPSLIKSHHVSTYEFNESQTEDYWRDVGTIDAYFEANLQLLNQTPSIELNDIDWPIHTSSKNAVPTHFAADSLGHLGLVTDCIIGSGCMLRGSQVRHSVIFTDVQIDEQTQIENSLVLPGATIGKRCRIKNAIIDSRTHLPDGTEIGFDKYSDAMHYRVTDKGIVVVTAEDIGTPEHKMYAVAQSEPETSDAQISVSTRT